MIQNRHKVTGTLNLVLRRDPGQAVFARSTLVGHGDSAGVCFNGTKINVIKTLINHLIFDGLYHPFMVSLWMV